MYTYVYCVGNPDNWQNTRHAVNAFTILNTNRVFFVCSIYTYLGTYNLVHLITQTFLIRYSANVEAQESTATRNWGTQSYVKNNRFFNAQSWLPYILL